MAFVCDPSVAQRSIPPKDRGSSVGFVIDPFRFRQIWYESDIEMKVLTVSIVDKEVVAVLEQQKVRYLRNGVLKDHTIDVIQHFNCGLRRAVFVKYDEDVEGSELKEIVQAIADYDNEHIADDFVIMTEEDINILDFENAEEIIESAKASNSATRKTVIDALPDMPDVVTPYEIGMFTGLGRSAEIASIALLQSGVLQLYDHEPIDVHSALINTGKFAA